MSENKIKPFDYGVGILAGYGATEMVGKARFELNRKIIESFSKNSRTINNDVFEKALNEAYKKNKLNKKEIQLVHIDEKNVQKHIERKIKDAHAEIDKKTIFKPLAKRQKRKQAQAIKNMFLATAEGKGGFYSYNGKGVHFNKNKSSLIAFHELGHAINHTTENFAFKLRNSINTRKITPLLLTVGLLVNKKENPENSFDKLDQFVKNNCGKLTFMCFVPILIEEALASVNAHRLAKPYLTKKQLSQLNKGNAKAWCTYLVGSTCTALGAALAVYVRDKIVGTKAPRNQNTNIPNSSQYYYPQYKV